MVKHSELISLGGRKKVLNLLVRTLEKRTYLPDADREILRAARAELKKVRLEEKRMAKRAQLVLL